MVDLSLLSQGYWVVIMSYDLTTVSKPVSRDVNFWSSWVAMPVI